MVDESYHYGPDPRPDVQPFVPTGISTLLDVGCGKGLFGAAVKARQPTTEVWGIDPASEVCDAALSNLDHFVLGSYPEDLPRRRFDCITFNDSLEHLVDPWAVMNETAALLAPGGLVIVSLPNVRNYAVIRRLVLNGEWEYKDIGILDRTHLRFFTRRSATRMFGECGFRVEAVHALNVSTHGPASSILRLAGRRSEEFRARQFLFLLRRAVAARAIGMDPSGNASSQHRDIP